MRNNFKQFNILFIVFLTFIFSLRSEAAGGGGSSPGPTIGVIVGFGQGNMGNGVDVQDRTMLYTPISLFAGFNIKKLRLGAQYEYDIVGQSSDPASVGNQNLSGKGSSPGARIEYYDGKQSFGLIYRLSDTYNLDKQTVAGTTATYKATSGFQVQYYRQVRKKFGIVLDYTSETFDTSLTNQVKWSRVSLGVVFTNFANSSGK